MSKKTKYFNESPVEAVIEKNIWLSLDWEEPDNLISSARLLLLDMHGADVSEKYFISGVGLDSDGDGGLELHKLRFEHEDIGSWFTLIIIVSMSGGLHERYALIRVFETQEDCPSF